MPSSTLPRTPPSPWEAPPADHLPSSAEEHPAAAAAEHPAGAAAEHLAGAPAEYPADVDPLDHADAGARVGWFFRGRHDAARERLRRLRGPAGGLRRIADAQLMVAALVDVKRVPRQDHHRSPQCQ